MSERANIKDVAARAGVAVKTVSRVLNGHPYVKAETRLRVEEAMRMLDFRPTISACSPSRWMWLTQTLANRCVGWSPKRT